MNNSSDRSVNIHGNMSGGILNSGVIKNMHVNNVSNIGGGNPLGQQLQQDLEQMQTCLEQLQSSNPNAGQAEANAVLTAMTPKPVQKRLVAAIASGSKAAIEEFLDNAYARVVVAIIEGWRS